ncbi:hypothetical protein GCM10017620_27550 [Brevundimonas intermedia]|uniref:Sporulation protein n=1 Tax=Brevundimonas intermedia TaxID=74315 RepID=A0ABQ5TDJ9_9CAUL|nr:hypothetical protein [Brevundimonas intermedia]GLK49781.1 hypothetical protein GCM10017620_27550 [Brevundimonas intermedia]
MKQPPNPGPGRDRGGWRAFALGMVGMFVVIAVWIALFEKGGDPKLDEVQQIGRPMAQADQAETPDSGPPISGYR